MKRQSLVMGATAILLFGFWTSQSSAELVLAEKGKSDYSIVLPKLAPKSVNDAAAEMQNDIALATGAKLPILKDNEPVEGPFISLGTTQQAKQADVSSDGIADGGFRILTKGGNLYIIGLDTTAVNLSRWIDRIGGTVDAELHPEIPGPAFTQNGGFSHGTANGVYTFLENHVGVRWLMPGDLGLSVPKTDRLTVDQIDHTESPTFTFRILLHLGQSAWAAHMKLGMSFRLNYGHSWATVVPPAMYDKHPDWFPMNAMGQRPRPMGRSYKLETTNPELVNYFAQQAVAAFRANPEMNTFSLSPTDSMGWSQSADSKALYDPPGPLTPAPSVTPLVLKFYRDVCKIVAKEYPQGKLVGYLYSNYKWPPQTGSIQLPDNFVPVFAGYGYRYRFYRKDIQDVNRKAVEGWAKVAPPNWFWYCAATWLRYQNGIVMPAAPEIFDYVFHLMVDSHMNGAVYYDINRWNQGAIINYTAAKMLWNPTLDAREVQKDWLSRAYGPKAGAAMETFYHHLDIWCAAYYERHKELPNAHLRPSFFEEIYGDHYAEMESLFMNAWDQPMTSRQKQRLAMIRDNLIILQWRLRNAGYVPAEISSSLRWSDDKIADMMMNTKGEYRWRLPGPPAITKTKVKLQDSTQVKAAETHQSSVPNPRYILLYPTRDQTIRMATSDLHLGVMFVDCSIIKPSMVRVKRTILHKNQTVEFKVEANAPYYLYLGGTGVEGFKDLAWKLAIPNAVVTTASYEKGVLSLQGSSSKAPLYVYVPESLNLYTHNDVAGAIVGTQSPAQAVGKAAKKNQQAAKQALNEALKHYKATVIQDLNYSWRFTTDPQKTGMQQAFFGRDFNDNDWKRLNAFGYWQQQGFKDYHGTAWYRKTFNIDSNAADILATGTHVLLFFGAVDGDAVVYLNGEKIGQHRIYDESHGWETPFVIDVTTNLATGKNVLAVKVTKDNFMAGIYRGVHLLAIGQNAAQATAVTYASQYEADHLPDETEGTATRPQWSAVNGPDQYAGVSNGILTVGTSKGNGAYYWKLAPGGKSASNAAWNGDSDAGSTIDFRVKISSGSDRVFSLIAGNSHTQVQLLIYNNKIKLMGDASHSYTPADDHLTTDYQTYRLVLKYNKASLYAAYSQTPLLDHVSVKKTKDNRLAFGKISRAYPGGAFDLDFIRWTNNGAKFAAPPSNGDRSEKSIGQ